MIVLANCCCCVELELGVTILGFLSALLSILDLGFVIYPFAKGEGVLDVDTVITLITVVVYFAVSVCLIIATFTKNKRLLVPYLVTSIINLIFLTVLLIKLGVHFDDLPKYLYTAFIAALVIVHLWLCVYSYYQRLAALV